MNAIHYRGSDGGRGTRLVDIVTGKMKGLLRRWTSGERAKSLREIHLHIDDPGLVIAQKRSEQARRDAARHSVWKKRSNNTGNASSEKNDETHETELQSLPGWCDELVIPWGTLLGDRKYKDELASLHLLCAASALEELASEHKQTFLIIMYGGAFVLPKDFVGMRTELLSFRRSTIDDPLQFKGRVIAEPFGCTDQDRPVLERYIAIPRDVPLLLHTASGLRIGSVSIAHGESETRFVAAFKHYIKPGLGVVSCQDVLHSCIVISDDTDVFMILLLAEVMKDHNVLHVLNGSVHAVDRAKNVLNELSSTTATIATIYALSGCDFTPGTFGVTHVSQGLLVSNM